MVPQSLFASLSLPDALLGGAVLVLSIALGTVAHELSHAAVLRALSVPHDLRWFPDRTETGFGGAFGRWAAVVPRRFPHGLSPWELQIAALAPLVLATPMALILLGALPDPVASGDLLRSATIVGWLACAIPSPADFSLVWHAEDALAAGRSASPADVDQRR